MFTTIAETNKLTGLTITQQTLIQAQMIIEAYCGRPEAEIEGARDAYLLGLATAYQAAYMEENRETIFQQVKVSSIGQGNSFTKFDPTSDAPFVAPLAEMACKGLSWKKSNSVHTGPMMSRQRYDWWRD